MHVKLPVKLYFFRLKYFFQNLNLKEKILVLKSKIACIILSRNLA